MGIGHGHGQGKYRQHIRRSCANARQVSVSEEDGRARKSARM